MTGDDFDAALAARGIAPAPADRAAALRVARFLADCVRRLREAPCPVPDDAD